VGCRGSKTLEPLWERVKACFPLVVCTDYWAAYASVIPHEIHLQSKAETHTVEGINAQIRHSLARFRRKTFCYSKSAEMVYLSLKLLFALKLSIS
jgi:insertion element IS1 protein InsB